MTLHHQAPPTDWPSHASPLSLPTAAPCTPDNPNAGLRIAALHSLAATTAAAQDAALFSGLLRASMAALQRLAEEAPEGPPEGGPAAALPYVEHVLCCLEVRHDDI